MQIIHGGFSQTEYANETQHPNQETEHYKYLRRNPPSTPFYSLPCNNLKVLMSVIGRGLCEHMVLW